MKLAYIKQVDRRTPRKLLQALCLAVVACCGPPAYGLELPDPSKPGGALPGQRIDVPRPFAVPEALPQLPKRPAPSQVGAQARIRVNKIELVGVVERPELGIVPAELARFVEQLRKQKIAEAKREHDSLFLPQQENKVLKEIEKIAEDARDQVDRKILQDAIDQFRARKFPDESLSLQQLQEIAASVAQYYRERGFILVQAFIPPQTIQQGIVQIRILEGILGHVTVEKNQRFTETQLLEPFQALTNQPVIKARIEEAMLLLNDYPGLKTFAVFRPGIYTGETDLLISVLQEERLAANAHVDNYGSSYTGEYRGRFDLTVNNPFGLNDRLISSVSQTVSPNNGLYSSLLYERRFDPKNILGLNFSRNGYLIGGDLAPFGIKGSTLEIGASWRHSIHRSRLFNSYGLLQFNRKTAKLDISEGDDRQDDLSVLSAELGYNWSDNLNRYFSNGWLQLSKGLGILNATEPTDDPDVAVSTRRGGSGNYASGLFTKLVGDAQYWMPWKRNQSFHFSVHGQYSNDMLTSMEQMAIGGPRSVRAYATSEFLRDKAISASAEWIVKAPGFADHPAFDGSKRWGEILEGVLFFDYAKGWLNDPLASDVAEVTLMGVGAGLRFNYDNISARFEFATPLSDREPGNERDPQYFFEVNYGF